MTRDWGEWHLKYDDPASGHPQRLAVVVEQIRAALDRAGPGPIRVLSLCAGDGRDIATAATGHPRAADLTGCLVELDAELAAAAREHLAPLGSRLEVRVANAGDPTVWADVVPVDLLLLCGIFGNVPDEDVERTALASAAMGRPRGDGDLDAASATARPDAGDPRVVHGRRLHVTRVLVGWSGRLRRRRRAARGPDAPTGSIAPAVRVHGGVRAPTGRRATATRPWRLPLTTSRGHRS